MVDPDFQVVQIGGIMARLLMSSRLDEKDQLLAVAPGGNTNNRLWSFNHQVRT